MHIRSVSIIGAGAIGAIYGMRLLDNLGPEHVHFIADGERKKRYETQGIIINGKKRMLPIVTPRQVPESDLVIVATKNMQLEAAIEAIGNAIGKKTAIISLLNGTESEETIGNAYGNEHMLYGFAISLSSRHYGNHIDCTEEGKIVFGEKTNERSERVAAIAALFDAAHIAYTIPDDIRQALWNKFMLNTAFNTVSAICDATYGHFAEEAFHTITDKVSREVQAVAAKEGVALPDSFIEHNYRTILGLEPGGKTSMCQDMEAGRETENRWFCGTVVKLGQKHGIPTPTCETLSLLVEGRTHVQITNLATRP